MHHVKSICEIANYRAGTIFAVVPHRKFWVTVENASTHSWCSDGKWIGDFPVGVKESPYTYYCITESGLEKNSYMFISYDPTENDRRI